MGDVTPLDEQRKLLQTQCDEFWYLLGVNARRLFYKHGLQWVSRGMQNQAASDLIRKGWEAEDARQLRIN